MAEEIKVPVKIGDASTVATVDRIEASVRKLDKAVDDLGKSTDDQRSKWERFRTSLGGDIATPQAIGNMATGLNSVVSLATQAAGAVRVVAQAAGEGERHLTAVNALGSAYDEVRRATGDTVTATQAYATQQRLLRSGLSVSSVQLATITRAARDYARATGTDATQATEQLAEALVGASADELQKYGVSLQSGLDRTEALTRATEQLAARQSESSPAARSLAEDLERTSTAATEAASAFATMASDGLGLQGIVSGIGDRLRALIADIQGATQAARAARATEQEVGDRQRALDERRLLTRELRERLTSAGVGADQLRAIAPEGAVLMRSSPEVLAAQNTRLRQALEAARMATPTTGESIATGFMQQRAGVTSGTMGLSQDELRAQLSGDRIRGGGSIRTALARQVAGQPGVQQAAQSLLTTAGDLTQELLRGVNAASREAINVTAAAPSRSGGARTDTTGAAMEAAHREAQRLRGTGVSAPTLGSMFEQAQQEREAQQARDRAERAAQDERHVRAVTDALAEQRAVRDALDAEQRDSLFGSILPGNERRLSLVTDQTAALRSQLADLDARITAVRAQGSAESELNGILAARERLQAAINEKDAESAQLRSTRMDSIKEYRDAMVSSLGSVADAFGEATAAAIDGEKSFAEALQGQMRQLFLALTKQSVVEALKNTALGFASLATPPLAAGYFKAAGLWAATGIAAGGIAASIPKPDASTGAASGSTRAPGAARARDGGTGSAASSGPLVLNINVSGALLNEGVEEGVVRALDRAATRGLSPRVLRAARGM